MLPLLKSIPSPRRTALPANFNVPFFESRMSAYLSNMDSGFDAAGVDSVDGVPLLAGEPGSPPGSPPGSFIPRRALSPPPSFGTTGAEAVFEADGRRFGGNLSPTGPANPAGDSGVEPVEIVELGSGLAGGAPCLDR